MFSLPVFVATAMFSSRTDKVADFVLHVSGATRRLSATVRSIKTFWTELTRRCRPIKHSELHFWQQAMQSLGMQSGAQTPRLQF